MFASCRVCIRPFLICAHCADARVASRVQIDADMPSCRMHASRGDPGPGNRCRGRLGVRWRVRRCKWGGLASMDLSVAAVAAAVCRRFIETRSGGGPRGGRVAVMMCCLTRPSRLNCRYGSVQFPPTGAARYLGRNRAVTAACLPTPAGAWVRDLAWMAAAGALRVGRRAARRGHAKSRLSVGCGNRPISTAWGRPGKSKYGTDGDVSSTRPVQCRANKP